MFILNTATFSKAWAKCEKRSEDRPSLNILRGNITNEAHNKGQIKNNNEKGKKERSNYTTTKEYAAKLNKVRQFLLKKNALEVSKQMQ